MKPIHSHLQKIILAVVSTIALFMVVFVPLPAAAVSESANCTTTSGKPGVHTTFTFTEERDSKGLPCLPISNGAGLQNGIVFSILRTILVFVGGGVGLAAVGGITFGGFLYMTARADAAQAKKGETVIRDSVIGLLVFFGMAAILNFIVPGGLLQ